VKLRGLGHKIEITHASNQGYASADGDGVELVGCNKCEVDIGGGANNKNVFKFTSENGPNYLHGVIDIGSGHTFRSGAAPNSQTTILFSANGAGGTFSEVKLPSATLNNSNGWSPVLPASNATLLSGDLATFIAKAAGDIPINSLFRNAADGKLSYKDNSGTVHALY
jgi:hypothetical protein